MNSKLSRGSRRAIVCVALLASTNMMIGGASRGDAAPLAATIAQKVAVPSYINPLADPVAWARLAASSADSLGFAVANVVNGPDYLPLDEWSRAIQGVSASGVKVVGYVDTGYLGTTGQRTRLGSTAANDWMSQIQHDISKWYQFYGTSLSGIFFDQTPNACGPTAGSNDWADLYQQLTNEVERLHPGSLTVLNPGVAVPQCYEDVGDVLVTFEGDYASYLGNPAAANPYVPLTWTPTDPMKIWHIVYGVPDVATETQILALSKARNAGYIYVTDDVLANPYDTLPSADYWATELASVVAVPGTNRPPNRPTGLDTVEVYATSVDLDWDGSRGRTPVVAYDIYRDGVLIDSVAGDTPRYTAVDLTPVTDYVFTVVARDSNGLTSEPSPALTVRTDETYGEAHKPPANLAASTTTFTSATLTWAPAKERTRKRPDIDAYVVLQNGREVLRLPGWVTSVTVGGLAPGAAYNFSVLNIDSTGDRSDESASVAVATPALPNAVTIGQTSVIETPDQFTYSAEFLVPVAFRRVFIATGNPADPCWSTGSDPQVCADYLIENERLLRYTGTGQDFDWVRVADVVPTIAGDVYTWAISPADIGSPTTAAAVFNANGYAPNAYCGTGFACVTNGPPLPYE